MASFKNRKFNY